MALGKQSRYMIQNQSDIKKNTHSKQGQRIIQQISMAGGVNQRQRAALEMARLQKVLTHAGCL